MNIPFKKYFTEVFRYRSEKPLAQFREALDNLFNNQHGMKGYFAVNLMGKFLSENEFEVKRKWELGTSSGAAGRNADTGMFLYGVIAENGNSTTVIISATSPGAPLAALGPIIGIIGLICTDYDTVGLLIILALIFVVPILILQFGYISKTRLKDKFVKQLELIPD